MQIQAIFKGRVKRACASFKVSTFSYLFKPSVHVHANTEVFIWIANLNVIKFVETNERFDFRF